MPSRSLHSSEELGKTEETIGIVSKSCGMLECHKHCGKTAEGDKFRVALRGGTGCTTE